MRKTLPNNHLCPASVVFKRYETIKGLQAAFHASVMKAAKVPKSEWKNYSDPDQDVWDKGIQRLGFWGFADGEKTVSYWANKDVPKWKLFYLLGHEVGHLSHKPRNGIQEELRADSYGAAASAVWNHLRRRGDVK